MKPERYTTKSAVGCIVKETMDKLVKDPWLISKEGEFWERNFCEKDVEKGANWLHEVDLWLREETRKDQNEVDRWLREETGKDQNEKESQFVRIIITANDKATAELIKKKFSNDDKTETNTSSAPIKVLEIDAGHKMKFDDTKGVTHFVNNKIGAPSISYAASGSPAENDGMQTTSTKARIQPAREAYILSRASFLPNSKLEYIVSECAKRKIKLIMLVAEATFSISRFRVFKELGTTNLVPPVWIRVPTITQKLIFGTLPHTGKGMDGDKADAVWRAFVGLQLIFSPEAVITFEQHVSVKEFLTSSEDDRLNKLNFMGNFDCLSGIQVEGSEYASSEDQTAYIRCTMLEILSGELDLKEETPDPQDRAKWNLGCVLAEHVKRYIHMDVPHDDTQDDDTQDDDPPLVSFSDFCKQPKVRFLSQIHRIEAYIWFLFQATDEEHRFSACGTRFTSPESPFGWPLGACFELRQALHANVHLAASPGMILRCSLKASYSEPAALPRELPHPEYVDPGKGDAVTQMQDIFEHRALAGCELHWEDMYRNWQTGPHKVTYEVLDHVLIHSPCRLSVLLSLPEGLIVNQSNYLSKETIGKVADDFEECKALFR